MALLNPQAWSWSGKTLMETNHLLSMTGVYDATDTLRRYAPETPEETLAASYERAVFDLLYTAVIKGKRVPNLQPTDIDDAVDFSLVAQCIESADLAPDKRKRMLAWLRDQ